MIIVTGATGFLGRRFIKQLIKEYPLEEILCLVRNDSNPLEESGRQILKRLNVKTKEIDLVTGYGLDNLPKNPRIIFHLAANTETLERDHRSNHPGTQNLLKAFGKLSKNTHFIHVSTLVIYSGRPDTRKPINEDSIPFPTNEYTRTKLEAEKVLLRAQKRQGFKLTIIRPNTIWGKGPRQNGLIDTLNKLLNNNSILGRLNWPGKASLIYVEDMAKALILLSQKPPRGKNPEIFIADPEALTLSEMSKIMHEANGLTYNQIIMPKIFWQFCRYLRPHIYKLEAILPYSIYNWLWRFTLIIDDVIYCKTDKLRRKITSWRPTSFAKKVQDII